jgi:hypothetical protein
MIDYNEVKAQALKTELQDIVASVRENFRDIRSDDTLDDQLIISEARLITRLDDLLAIFDSDVKAYVIDTQSDNALVRVLTAMHETYVAAFESDELSEEDESDLNAIERLIDRMCKRHDVKIVA